MSTSDSCPLTDRVAAAVSRSSMQREFRKACAIKAAPEREPGCLTRLRPMPFCLLHTPLRAHDCAISHIFYACLWFGHFNPASQRNTRPPSDLTDAFLRNGSTSTSLHLASALAWWRAERHFAGCSHRSDLQISGCEHQETNLHIGKFFLVVQTNSHFRLTAPTRARTGTVVAF